MSSNKCTKIENKIPIHNVFTSSEMMKNETRMGWRFIKRRWRQDSQGAFEWKFEQDEFKREGQKKWFKEEQTHSFKKGTLCADCWEAMKP